MAKRPTRIKRTEIMEGKAPRRRIIIPQPPDRPFKLEGRDAIRADAKGKNPGWITVHRRGIYRPKYGEDPLERRAVGKQYVKGFLRERIVYKFLVHRMRMMPGADFTFQSSLFGGRLELGGIVADFMFEYLRIIINVQGPTHTEWLRSAKDKENEGILRDMGFTTYDLPIELIDNEWRFENEMRKIFNLNPVGGGQGGQGVMPAYNETDPVSAIDYSPLYRATVKLENRLDEVVTRLQRM